MIWDLLLLLSALVIVGKFSSVIVDSAVRLSQITGISRAVIGFIFIGVGTSLPELAIGIISSLERQGALSVGNLIGANVTNLTLILGIMSFIGFNLGKIYAQKMKRAVALTAGITFILILGGVTSFLFGLFLVCVYYLFFATIMKEGFVLDNRINGSVARAALKLVISISIVVAAAYVTTNSAVALASVLGIASPLIGATLISIGTTVPELSVNIAAIKKRNIPLAVGDSIGTIVSNLALILGIVSMINPVIISAEIAALGITSILACAIVYVLAGRMAFGLKEAFFLSSFYVLYLLFIMLSGAL